MERGMRRRTFLRRGVAGCAATCGGVLSSAQSAPEHTPAGPGSVTMRIGTHARKLGESFCGHLCEALQRNIETLSEGRVHVSIETMGTAGRDVHTLVRVRQRRLQAAQHSLSNLTAFIPAMDLLSLPFWADTPARFLNLVSSPAWRSIMEPPVNAAGFEILLYLPIGMRVLAVRRGMPAPVARPEDLRGKRVRVPASRVLRTFYRHCGGAPVPVPWNALAPQLESGALDIVDPAIPALFHGGLGEYLGAISQIGAVVHGHAITANRRWLEGLPANAQHAIREGAQRAFREVVDHISMTFRHAGQALEAEGAEILALDADTRAAWRQKAGAQATQWAELKTQLAGSPREFKLLDDAVRAPGPYTGRFPELGNMT